MFEYDEGKNENQSGRRFALVLDVIKVRRTNQVEVMLDYKYMAVHTKMFDSH